MSSKVLQKLYYDPSHGFISQEKFFQKIKHILPQITRKQKNFYKKSRGLSTIVTIQTFNSIYYLS